MRQHASRTALVGIAVAGLSVTLTTSVDATPVSGPAPGRSAPEPAGSMVETVVDDVAAVSPSSAWAAGAALGPRHGGLVQHWDGDAWSTVLDDLRRGDNGEALNGIAAGSDTDVWAVGSAVDPERDDYGVALHWDGASWQRLRSPAFRLGSSTHLNDVTLVSPTNVWIVGSYEPSDGVAAPLVVHWNGTAFQRVPAPHPARNPTEFHAVSAASGNDVWATAAVGDPDDPNHAWSLVERWDGQTWRRLTPPRPPWRPGHGQSSGLSGLAAVGRGRAWVVGSGRAAKPLVEHYVDGRWIRVRLPRPPAGTDEPTAVSATSDSDVWIVGANFAAKKAITTMTMHWDGSAWTRVPSPNRPPGRSAGPVGTAPPGGVGGFASTSILESVSDRGPGQTWATGEYERFLPSGGIRLVPLQLLWTGHRWLRR